MGARVGRGQGAHFTSVTLARVANCFSLPALLPLQMGQAFWYLDDTAARQQLGFQPRPAEDTIKDTVDFLRQHEIQLLQLQHSSP